MEENSKFYMIFGLLLIIVVLFAVIIFAGGKTESTASDRVISVNGYAEQKTMPNEAYVYFSIETDASTAKEAQEKNAKIWDTLKSELDKKDFIKYSTEGYNVWPNQEWDENTKKVVTNGYKVSNNIRITLSNIDETGSILDLIVKSGVNNVNSVSFGLSKTKETEIKNELWKDAVSDAKGKAVAVVSATGAKIKDTPKTISLSEYGYNPPVYYNTKSEASAGSADISTDIAPRELNVSVSLTLTYEYK